MVPEASIIPDKSTMVWLRGFWSKGKITTPVAGLGTGVSVVVVYAGDCVEDCAGWVEVSSGCVVEVVPVVVVVVVVVEVEVVVVEVVVVVSVDVAGLTITCPLFTSRPGKLLPFSSVNTTSVKVRVEDPLAPDLAVK